MREIFISLSYNTARASCGQTSLRTYVFRFRPNQIIEYSGESFRRKAKLDFLRDKKTKGLIAAKELIVRPRSGKTVAVVASIATGTPFGSDPHVQIGNTLSDVNDHRSEILLINTDSQAAKINKNQRIASYDVCFRWSERGTSAEIKWTLKTC